jgi:uncharacterized membrane protein YhaH (DUF805 family)
MRRPHPRLAFASLMLFVLAGTAARADVMPAPTAAAIALIPLITIALFVFALVMTLLSCVRLLHRTGHSGWWALLMFVPLVNVIGLWIWAFTPNGKRPTNA